ncbi:PaaI family thioesterase [Pseudobacillus sp. FSL P4-0506]|uniref:PaaI family thioesterase n=1 Tax=unclassified Pseudobacillus TaxID=2619284 RepID=UPI0030FC58C2
MEAAKKVDHSFFFSYLGLERQEDEAGAAVLSVKLVDSHLSETGKVAGGLFYTMLDAAMGTAVSEAGGAFGVTTDLHVQILRNEASRLFVCKGYCSGIEGKNASGRGEIFDESGRLVASGMAAFKLLTAEAKQSYKE